MNALEAKPLFLAGGTPKAYLFAHKQRPAKCFWVPPGTREGYADNSGPGRAMACGQCNFQVVIYALQDLYLWQPCRLV